MPRLITSILQAWAERRRARRRQSNLRAGALRAMGATQPTQPTQSGGRLPAARRGAQQSKPAQPGAVKWIAAAGCAAALAGALLIAAHARHLAAATVSTPQAADSVRAAAAYQSVLPGIAFTVTSQPGLSASLVPGGALLVASGMQASPPVRVDLCSQLRVPAGGSAAGSIAGSSAGSAAGATAGASDARLVPLRLGARFEDVKRWVANNRDASVQIALRNVLLIDERDAGAGAMPEVQISGAARADFADPLSEPLQLSWRSPQQGVRWLSDASYGQIEQGASGRVALRQQGWLMWNGAALRIERRANILCPQAGELLVQLYKLKPQAAGTDAAMAQELAPAPALVVAFPARGKAVGAYLAAGQYRVPAAAAAPLEDQSLFQELQDKGLVRLNGAGAVELAPRDLQQWLAAGATQRAAPLDGWSQVKSDAATHKLFKRLYFQADGAYVRQQIDIFNSERRLLAWRMGAAVPEALSWQASMASAAVQGSSGAAAAAPSTEPVAVATTGQMPVAASRLFASLPQGWQAWTRVARWPQLQAADGRAAAPLVRLSLPLAQAAAGGETVLLMLAGRVQGVAGGAAMQLHPVCTGRACSSAGDVQQIALTLQAGARSVQLDVRPLDFSAPEDQKYRHIRVAGGRLSWQPLAPAAGEGVPGMSRSAAVASPVLLQDRNGALLWADGAPTQAAIDAGLAPLLGVSAEQANSVAGMLARLPVSTATMLPASATSASGAAGAAGAAAAVGARLSLDLPLQALSQHVLDCVGMRRGRWDGKACSGGRAGPENRHAGMVIIDTETGDVLAAAGAGAGVVSAANWAEVRDFDRTSPARSPLRLPALQHDGGAHQSPGSTFKVISALGLELAAQSDPQIDALLAGMPLPAINRLAQQRGFGFQTDAASYPLNPRLAHITNYHEQSLDRRAQEGRLGLAQALTYSLNTWFAWSSELSDRSLFGRPDGGAPDLQALDADALDAVRPIVAAAHRLGFEQTLRLDGGLLPADFNWRGWDALQATPAHIDPIHTRHELRQMAIGLRMQVTPLQMALAAAAVGQGKVVAPRMLLALGQASSSVPQMKPVGVRLDRIRAGMKGVVDVGTGAGAFGGAALAGLRPGLYGKTGTAPSGDDTATVWFTGWLEPGSLPGQTHRLAMAAFISHSDATGGEHAAPVVAAVLATLAAGRTEQQPGQQLKGVQKGEQKGK